MYKLLLCWRYLRTRYLALVCIVSVMLGVATLIVVNSVMAGFSTKLKDRLHGCLSDIVVESTDPIDGFPFTSDDMMKRIQDSPVGPHIEAMTPAVEIFALIQVEHQRPQLHPARHAWASMQSCKRKSAALPNTSSRRRTAITRRSTSTPMPCGASRRITGRRGHSRRGRRPFPLPIRTCSSCRRSANRAPRSTTAAKTAGNGCAAQPGGEVLRHHPRPRHRPLPGPENRSKKSASWNAATA